MYIANVLLIYNKNISTYFRLIFYPFKHIAPWWHRTANATTHEVLHIAKLDKMDCKLRLLINTSSLFPRYILLQPGAVCIYVRSE